MPCATRRHVSVIYRHSFPSVNHRAFFRFCTCTPARARKYSDILHECTSAADAALAHKYPQPEYFGQYGEITKLVINHHQGVAADDPRHGSASAYITFTRQEDAWAAICSVDGFRLMGRTIRASFGTTKYCNSFLRNLPCNNPECLYLHELGDEEDRFTKDEVQLGLARHGSSFAFKEEILATTSGGDGSRRGPTGGSYPQPLNPVLPPARPVVPPNLAAVSSPATPIAMSHSGGGDVVTYNGRPTAQSLPRISGDEQQGAMRGGCAMEMIGGNAGTVPTPPRGADGRPRPRRRRGQRGRRGGGGGGSGNSGNGTPGENRSERAALGGDDGSRTGQSCDPGEGCVGTLGELCPAAPQAEWVQNAGAGGCGCYGGRDSASVYNQGSDLTTMNVEQLARLGTRPAYPTTTAVPWLPSSSSLLASNFRGLDAQELYTTTCAGGRVGNGSAAAHFNGFGDFCLPVPQQPSAWGGSDRSVGSGRSVGGAEKSNNCWSKLHGVAGRGSPLPTTETLTNTPPVGLSPSEPASSPSTSRPLPGLNSLGSRSGWDLRSIGADSCSAGSSGHDDATDFGDRNDLGEQRERGIGSRLYSHGTLQMQSPPAFFGFDDGSRDSRGGTRGGDLEPIAETCKQQHNHQRHHSELSGGFNLEFANGGGCDNAHFSTRQQCDGNVSAPASQAVPSTPPGFDNGDGNCHGNSGEGTLRREYSGNLYDDARFGKGIAAVDTDGNGNGTAAPRDDRSVRFDDGDDCGQGGRVVGYENGGGGSVTSDRTGYGREEGGGQDGGLRGIQLAFTAFSPFSTPSATTASQEEVSRRQFWMCRT